MDIFVQSAYIAIFGTSPDPDAPEWKVAKDVSEHWNVPRMGEELAKRCILRIANHITFPVIEMTPQFSDGIGGRFRELFPVEVGGRPLNERTFVEVEIEFLANEAA